MIREILTFRPIRQGTDIDGALEYLSKVTRRRVVAFLISDFLDAEFSDALRVAARRHDLTAVSVADPREEDLPSLGLVELRDAETGESFVLDTSNRRLVEEYREAGRQHRTALQELFRSTGVGEIEVRTDRAYVDAIVRFFRSREQSRGSFRARGSYS